MHLCLILQIEKENWFSVQLKVPKFCFLVKTLDWVFFTYAVGSGRGAAGGFFWLFFKDQQKHFKNYSFSEISRKEL